ncbi:thymosin beta [Diaphorina citri]|uniref:Thymosin beta n=1 Tax=Diaphorina citri TaxID=121845 RepID=A0A1S4ES95_DIACI|nr:thymosin beta [Diaphorina citri]
MVICRLTAPPSNTTLQGLKGWDVYVKAEKTHNALIEGVEAFDTAKLKHAETQEKNPLPDKDAYEDKKSKEKLISGIENFDTGKLKHTETVEKNPLPTKEAIDLEKKA